MRRRVHHRPKHAAPSCGVSWCRDPNCGVSQAIERPSLLGELAGIAIRECRDVRLARLSSTPRRVATRFGVSLLLSLASFTAIVDAPAAALGAVTDAVVDAAGAPRWSNGD